MIMPIKLINIGITSHNNLVCACVYVMRTVKISQRISSIQYSVINWAIHCIPEFIHLTSENVYPFDQYTSIYLTFLSLANIILLCFFAFVCFRFHM